MATITNTSIPHTERTQSEPRGAIEAVILSRIDQINPTVRLLRLTPLDRSHVIKFLPGQYLDTHIPGLPNAGGFTLTSAPADAKPSSHGPGFLELAVQKSSNPAAQWLWKPETEILGSQLVVRPGGRFVWPPAGLGVGGEGVGRVVLVAGGVGVNPLVSIATQVLKHTPRELRPRELRVLYTTRLPPSRLREEVLFYERLGALVAGAADHDSEAEGRPDVSLRFFFTNAREGEVGPAEGAVQAVGRRIEERDLVEAGSGAGGAEVRKRTVAYVCGPPGMTDEFVEVLGRQEGMSRERVLCEKWW